jgi:hypothetical protein
MNLNSKHWFKFCILNYYNFYYFFKLWNNTVNGIYNPTAKKTNWIDELYKKYNFTGKTYALIFYGRKAQATILLRYLEENLKVNGGILIIETKLYISPLITKKKYSFTIVSPKLLSLFIYSHINSTKPSFKKHINSNLIKLFNLFNHVWDSDIF